MCLSTSCRMKPGASMTLSASGPCRRSNSPRNCFSSCAISSLRRGSARPFVGRGGIPEYAGRLRGQHRPELTTVPAADRKNQRGVAAWQAWEATRLRAAAPTGTAVS